MKSSELQKDTGYPSKVAVHWIYNDGDVGWVLAFFDNGDLTMGFRDRRLDAIGPVASPEEFKQLYPTNPNFHAVHMRAEARAWVQCEIEKAMSHLRERMGPWTRSDLTVIRNTLTLAIDEKRKADRSFFGGIPWPRNSPAEGAEAVALRDKAQPLAEGLRNLTRKYNNAAFVVFKRFKEIAAIREADDFMAAPLEQALETLLNDGCSPLGTLALEYIGNTAHGETAAVHIERFEESGVEPAVQIRVLQGAANELMNKINKKPRPKWFRLEKSPARSKSEKDDKAEPAAPVC